MAHHDPNRPTVAEVMPMVRALYAGERPCTRHTEIVGGHLHLVLDDGEVATHHVTFCLNEALSDGCEPCFELAQHLMLMSPTQRLRLYRERFVHEPR